MQQSLLGPLKQRHSGCVIWIDFWSAMQKDMNDDESIQLALDASKCPNGRGAPEGGVTWNILKSKDAFPLEMFEIMLDKSPTMC
jgi:hypothetical protein